VFAILTSTHYWLMIISKKFIFPLFLVILISLLFIGGPGHYSNRIYKNVWDLGHILLFIVLTAYLLKLPFIERKNPYAQVAIVCSIALFIALITEFLQSYVGRTPELMDIRRDILGAFIGLIIVFKQKNLSRKIFLVLLFIAFAFTTFEFSALTKTLIDEYNILRTGSILSNLEGPFEDERWKGTSRYTLSKDFVIEGEQSLKVTFNTDPYNGIALIYMHRDWSNKNYLHLSIYYPGDNALLLNVRINDFLHTKNNHYNDRFNKEIIIENGWNDLIFSINDIKNAPKGRQANLKNMQSLGMFVMNLPEPKTIYIDNVYLN